MDSIVGTFTRNKHMNNSFVDEFVNKYFPFSYTKYHMKKKNQMSFSFH